MSAQPPQQQLTFSQQMFRPISAPLLMKYGSARILKVGIMTTILGAFLFALPWVIGIFAMQYGWEWPGFGGVYLFFGIIFAGGIIMLIGLSLFRIGEIAWMFELHEVSKYKRVSATGMLDYLIGGIKKDEVQKAKDDYYRPYYYQPPPPKPIIKKKVPQSHLCPRCRSKILPGDELCLSCGEPLN